jgi:hypothetical protein
MSKYQPDYRLTPKELLVALVNYDNGSYYQLDDVVFGELNKLTNDKDGRDTSIQLAFKMPPLPQTLETYKYNRIKMTVIFESVLKDPDRRRYGVDFYDTDGELKVNDFITYLKESFGFTLHNLDVDFRLAPLAEKEAGVMITPDLLNLSYQESVVIPLLPPLKSRVLINTDLRLYPA